MQIVSLGDNLHEMPKPILWEKLKKYITICRLLESYFKSDQQSHKYRIQPAVWWLLTACMYSLSILFEELKIIAK